MIDFNRPAFTGKEFENTRDAVERGVPGGAGIYTKKCSAWMEERFHVGHVMLTTSCTHALEMAAFLADIQPGDEVIMPTDKGNIIGFSAVDGSRLWVRNVSIALVNPMEVWSEGEVTYILASTMDGTVTLLRR